MKQGCAPGRHAFEKFDAHHIFCTKCGSVETIGAEPYVYPVPAWPYYPPPYPHYPYYPPVRPTWWSPNWTVSGATTVSGSVATTVSGSVDLSSTAKSYPPGTTISLTSGPTQ